MKLKSGLEDNEEEQQVNEQELVPNWRETRSAEPRPTLSAGHRCKDLDGQRAAQGEVAWDFKLSYMSHRTQGQTCQ